MGELLSKKNEKFNLVIVYIKALQKERKSVVQMLNYRMPHTTAESAVNFYDAKISLQDVREEWKRLY